MRLEYIINTVSAALESQYLCIIFFLWRISWKCPRKREESDGQILTFPFKQLNKFKNIDSESNKKIKKKFTLLPTNNSL